MRRGKLSYGAAGLLAAAAAVAWPAAAPAAPTWLEPVTLGDGASGTAVATGGSGDAVAVWVDGAGRVVASVRPAGGSFGAPQVLGAAPAIGPDVAMADDGRAVAAWRRGSAVEFATRAPGGGFGTAGALAGDGGSGDPFDIRVAVNRGGEALIAYGRDRAHATTGPVGGPFGVPKPVSGAGACGLRADLADSGHAALAWHACGGGAAGVARRAPGAAFGAEEPLSAATGVAVAVEEDGTTVAGLEAGGAIRIAQAAPGGPFDSPRQISDRDELPAREPALAAGGGEVWAAWRQRTAGPVIATARRPAGGSFAAPEVASGPGAAGPPQLAAGSEGTFALAWLRDAGEPGVLAEGAHRAPGAARFGPAAAISAGGGASALDLGADADGNALAGHLRSGKAVVRALDAAGPRATAIEARTAGFAQDAYPFGFEPVDAWSAVTSAAIDFGDGRSVAARRAEHAYASQGDKLVTFSATDAVGNTASTQRLFQAAPPLDRTAPVVTRLRMDARRFRVSGKGTAVAAAVRRGTRFRYTLSEPAQATIFFERVRLGRKRKGGCRRGGRRGKRCRIYEPVGLITRTHAVAGKVSVGFSGRIVAHQGPLKIADIRLRPGRYRATVVAADANRNASKPSELGFTVLR